MTTTEKTQIPLASSERCCDDDSCCCTGECNCDDSSCCTLESIVSVDERGQMVLPKDVRERVGIKAGDKLALVLIQNKNSACCISLMKTADLSNVVKASLEPTMKQVFK